MGDGRQPAEWRRPAVVQPITRVKRLGTFGLRGKHGGIRGHPGHLEPGQHGGHLAAVQLDGLCALARLFQQVGEL